jgi:tRNA nucleotidyltransferase/poly(A) polymerase
MSFKKYYIIETEAIKDFKEYISKNPLLKKATEIIEILSKHGKAYIVGGAVRDIVLGKEPDDIDIATNVPMDKIEDLFPSHDIGKNKDFGIVVIEYKDENFEIAQFRKDGTYTDGRRPDSVKIVPDFKDDAARRDFTINAMAIDPEGNIIDYFDGLKDIKDKVLRTVGNPSERFGEDHLRMLRAIRFATRLGFALDPETKQAIKTGSQNINNIAAERIQKELVKMAEQEGSKFADAIVELDDTGLLQHILPEIVKLKEFKHNVAHHPEGGVWDHTIAALRVNKVKDPIINLSVLLHDIGKQKTLTQDSKGEHYFGHAEEAKEFIEQIAERLKLDTKTKEALLFAAMNHMKIHDFLELSNSTVIKLMDSPYWEVLKATAEADEKARGEIFDEKEWAQITARINKMADGAADRKHIEAVKKVVNGKWVMELKKIKPGPEVGKIIVKTVEWIQNNDVDITDTNKIKEYILSL